MPTFPGRRDETLTPALASNNPEAYKACALQAVGRFSIYGAAVWNYVLENGSITPDGVAIDSSTWVSRSNGAGTMTIGTQPMPAAMKERVMFHSERFDYPREVSYRLLHETDHGFVYLTQRTPAMRRLLTATTSVRDTTSGKLGLSALGSLDFYQGDKKVIEDTTELVTMYGWNPEYLAEFVAFLASPSQEAIRQSVGLATMTQPDLIYNLVEEAVLENL